MRSGGANRVVGVDIKRYLLREATALARVGGLDGTSPCQGKGLWNTCSWSSSGLF